MTEEALPALIDITKPTTGVPGLLLMVALVFFGATVGVALALMCSWIEMKDSLANFLGGVVGAALGAVFAIGGAVYVQRADERSRLRAPTNLMLSRAEALRGYLFIAKEIIGGTAPSTFATLSQSLREDIALGFLPTLKSGVEEMPEGVELLPSIHAKALILKQNIPLLVEVLEDRLRNGASILPLDASDYAMKALDTNAEEVRKLTDMVRAT